MAASNKGELIRMAPNSQESEKAVLGAVLLDDSAFLRLKGLLQPRDFYRDAHRKIFSAFNSLHAQKIPIDLVTATSELRRSEALEQCGGAAYLASLTDGIAGAMNVEHYAQEIRETADRRRIIELSNELLTRSYENSASAAELLRDARDRFSELTNQNQRQPVLPTFQSAIDIMKEPAPVEVVEGIAYENKVSVVVSESGTGKTFLLTSISAAVSSGVSWLGRSVQHGSVAYISFEGDVLGLRLRAIKDWQGHRLENLYFLRAYDPLSPVIDHDQHEISSPGAMLVNAQLSALNDTLATHGRPPIRLVVIDTVRASLTGSEDSSECVAAYLRAVRRILAHAPGAAAVLAHHSGWQDGESRRKRERGSSAFRGNSDATLYLELAGEDPGRGEAYLALRTYKMRDAEKPASLSCIRRRVSLNEADAKGEPRTSCVIEPDLRSPEEREAETTSAVDAENRILDLKALRVIADRPDLATSQNSIRVALGLQREPAYEAIARLLRLRWIDMPEKQRKPYTITELE